MRLVVTFTTQILEVTGRGDVVLCELSVYIREKMSCITYGYKFLVRRINEHCYDVGSISSFFFVVLLSN